LSSQVNFYFVYQFIFLNQARFDQFQFSLGFKSMAKVRAKFSFFSYSCQSYDFLFF